MEKAGVKKPRASAKLTPPEVTARINPTVRNRLLVVLSFPLIILLAVPFWWYTTSIERLPLPAARIHALENSTSVDTRTDILFTADEDAFPKPPPGRGDFDQDTILGSIAGVVEKSVVGILGQLRPHERGKKLWDLKIRTKMDRPPLRLHIRQSERANSSFPLRPYIQPKETGLMTSGLPAGTCVIPVHPSQMGDRMLNKHYQFAMIKALDALFPNVVSPPDIPLKALKYAPNVTLSFVLLNEDASQGSYVRSWDIEGAIRDHITPHLEPLKQVFNFTIESQVVYHAPLSFEPTYGNLPSDQVDPAQPAIEAAKGGDEQVAEIASQIVEHQREEAWLVSEDEMTVFVNSERWSLDSASTNNPVLRFMLYVPSPKHRPLRLAVPDTAQSFLIPQFGAVTILDVPTSAPQAPSFHLPLDALSPSFHLFTQNLYSLLALPLNPPFIETAPSPSPLLPQSPFLPPISPWQVEQVLRMRTRENSDEARKTLAGIVRLVSKIKEMKVGEGVRNKVLGAVERLEMLDRETDSLRASILARDAVALANEAFFDPSMMGLLYFPDEHKFAVYTPLFAPVAVPMLVELLKEFLAWRRRRRQRLQAAKSQTKVKAEPVLEQTEIGEPVETPSTTSSTSITELASPIDASVSDNVETTTSSIESIRTTRTLRPRKSAVK